jgi:WhiB family redox-sensing transcriptional regulator
MGASSLIDRPEWQDQANCAGMGPDVWFPGRGESISAQREICAACTVRAECLEFGLDEPAGIWGGLTGRERRRVRASRRRLGVVSA